MDEFPPASQPEIPIYAPPAPIKKPFPCFFAVLFLLLFSAVAAFGFKMYQLKQQLRQITTPSSVPSPLATTLPSSLSSPSLISEENTAQPATSITPVSKFALHIHAIDYSIGQDNGSLPGTTITLFDKSGNKMGQGVQGVDGPQEGPIGSPAYVDFSVPLGKYSYTAEKDTLIGKGSITISSFNDAAYKQIYLLAKPIIIKGRYFADENKNRQYDSGEKTFENQKITFFYHSEKLDKIWNAGSTQTGANGTFKTTLYEKWEGEYILGASQVPGYQELPQPHFQAKGGQTVNQDIYLWPL